MLAPFKLYNGVKIADEIDIACMKISAISSRGSKKDFIDMYFLLKTMTFDFLFEKFQEKYEGIDYNDKHILRSLMYFADADLEQDVKYIRGESMDWNEIKNSLVEVLKKAVLA